MRSSCSEEKDLVGARGQRATALVRHLEFWLVAQSQLIAGVPGVDLEHADYLTEALLASALTRRTDEIA